MPGNNDYPPAFSQNAISSTIGQINDFAGSQSSQARQLKASDASSESLKNPGAGVPIPVVITGSRPENAICFPGLRETMIGAAIVQLADQIPADNSLRDQIKKLAYELHAYGAEQIVKTQKGGKSRARKG